MQSTSSSELSLSKLMLGTVQFGLPYGVANAKGQPSYREVIDIISVAFEGGVNCLDTAPLYGSSEEVVGQAIAELGLGDRITVITKVKHMADELSVAAADKIVEESVVLSLQRLHLDSLPICLFHREENYRYVDSLLKLKERGLVQEVGSSVIHPSTTLEFLASGKAAALQIPANIVDQRFLRAGVLREAASRGTKIFVRSVYLQGLLLMPEQNVPDDLLSILPLRRNLEALAKQAGIAMSELAARYVLSMDGVTSVIVGVESVEQMKDNLELFGKGPIDSALVRAIDEIVPQLSDDILLPNRWSKRMPDAVLATS